MKKLIQSFCTSLLLIGFLSFATPKIANAEDDCFVIADVGLTCMYIFSVHFQCGDLAYMADMVADMNLRFCGDEVDEVLVILDF